MNVVHRPIFAVQSVKDNILRIKASAYSELMFRNMICSCGASKPFYLTFVTFCEFW